MYEYFDYDIENASFEWDDEKDHLKYVRTRNTRRKKDTTSLEKSEKYSLLYAHLGRIMWYD